MWVEKSRDKFRLCERYKGPDGRIHKASVPILKDTPKERKQGYKEILNIINGADLNIDDVKLSELIDIYTARADIKESTRGMYKSSFKKIIEVLGDPVFDNITGIYIKRKLSETDLNAAQKNRLIKHIKILSHYAVEYGYATKPIQLSYFKNEVIKDIESLYLTREELSDFFEITRGTDIYYICKFMALTGCRVGEVCALTIDDIQGDYIKINKTRYDGRIQTAKTAASNRDIFIQTELKEFLNEYMHIRNLWQIARGIRNDLLFFNRKGNAFEATHVYRKLKEVDFEKHLHPHIFRHTHASLLAESGYDLEAIARRLGHSSSDTTKQIYLHVTKKMKQKDEEKIKEIRMLS